MVNNKPLARRIAGLRSSMPAGYILGRASPGEGDVEMLSLMRLQSSGLIPSSLPPSGTAGGDLYGAYPNPGVAALRGLLLNTTAPTTGQVLEYDGTKLTWTTPAGGSGLIGVGAPTMYEPAGTLYSQSDAAAVWSSQPIALGTADIVQHASFVEGNTVPGSVTLTSSPTVGNLLIAFISWDNAGQPQPIVSTGWTQFITISNSTDVAGFALYRYVQAGDVAALPAFCTSGSAYWAASVYEIGNMEGVFATDVILAEGSWSSSNSVTSTAQVTTAANQLAIIAGGQYDGTTNPSFSSGWTTDETQNNGSNFGSVAAAHQVVSSSGTSVSGTITTNSSRATTLFQVILRGVGTMAAWDLIGPTTPGISSAASLARSNIGF